MAQFSDPDIERISNRIRELGMIQKAVAQKAGINPVYLSYILNGKRPLTSNVREVLFFVLDIR